MIALLRFKTCLAGKESIWNSYIDKHSTKVSQNKEKKMINSNDWEKEKFNNLSVEERNTVMFFLINKIWLNGRATKRDLANAYKMATK